MLVLGIEIMLAGSTANSPTNWAMNIEHLLDTKYTQERHNLPLFVAYVLSSHIIVVRKQRECYTHSLRLSLYSFILSGSPACEVLPNPIKLAIKIDQYTYYEATVLLHSFKPMKAENIPVLLSSGIQFNAYRSDVVVEWIAVKWEEALKIQGIQMSQIYL